MEMWPNPRWSKYVEKLQEFRLMDDDFMSAVFADNPAAVELVIQIILKRKDIKVEKVLVQHELKNLKGHSIKLDVHVIDADGRHFNVEIQKYHAGAGYKRARYNLALIDSYCLDKGEDYSALPETYIIFITEEDVLKKGLPIYHIERMITETNELFQDEAHIIYVNGSYVGDDDLGKLMKDFRTKEPKEMHFKTLAERANYLKHNVEGVSNMCKIMEDLCNESREEGRVMGREEGRVMGREEGRVMGREEGLIEGAMKAYKNAGFSLEDIIQKIMQDFGFSKETASEKVHLYFN